jgi:hypothetical protein
MSKTIYCVYLEHTDKSTDLPWTRVTLLGFFLDEGNALKHLEKMKAEKEYVHRLEEDHVYMALFESEVPIERDVNDL